MEIKKLVRFFIIPAYKPFVGIRELINTSKKLLYGVIIFLFLGIIYTILVQLAYMKGLGAETKPFINIPAEDYYYWQRYYQIILFFITTIIFAGVIALLSYSIGGSGNFIDLFIILSVCQTLPMFLTMWVPETILFVWFPGTVITPVWLDAARQILGIVWPLVITVGGIVIVEKIKWYYAGAFTLIGSIPMTAIMIIFIR
jgi:hypothetical protein